MTGEVLRHPDERALRDSGVGRYLQWLATHRGVRFQDYETLWRWSVDDLPAFWRSIWDYFEVVAHDPPSDVLTDDRMPGATWFPGATLNYAEQALRGEPDAPAIIARSQTRPPSEMTRAELTEAMARAAAGLRRLGVGPGDRVAGYLPNISEAVIALLATASIGAVWAACAPELGAQSVLDRLTQIEPKVLIAVDGYRYGDKDIDRRREIDTIKTGLPSITACVHVPYLYPPTSAGLSWSDLTAVAAEPAYAAVPFDHPLWVLFSSGTTGLPKAIVHSHGGIVVEHLKSHRLQSDLGIDDRYFLYCTTTWVMWNILVSGLLVGAAVVLFDGNPTFPDPLELWRVVEETGTTAFGCGASFLMACRQQGQDPGGTFDLSKLRSLASTGSPLPAEGFRWVYEHVNPSLYLQSGSGGTDVCTGFVGGSPLLPVRAGEIAGRCLGVRVEALDAAGRPVIGEPGELVVSAPMPSMPVCFWNDPDDRRYRATYFETYPGRWRHGDWIVFNAHGGSVITGRSDGTLNRGGVRLGTAEFYAALDDVSGVADSLVVHLEDASGGPGQLLLFVELTPGAVLDDALRDRISAQLRRRLSPRHGPDRILHVPAIPYNLTGKKLEVPVKRLLQGADRTEVVSDGAIRDPSAMDVFVELAAAS